MSAATAYPSSGNPSISRCPSLVRPESGSRGSAGTLGALERWRIVADGIERVQVDERSVEYPRMDPRLEGAAFRYGYALETAWAAVPPASGPSAGVAEAAPVGLLKFDLARDEIASWSPGAGRTPNEPLFVRAIDGHGDDEGWLLTVVDDTEPWRKRHLRPGRHRPGSCADPRQSFTCRRDCRCGATESGCRRTGIADRSDRTGAGSGRRRSRASRVSATVHTCMAPTLVKDGPDRPRCRGQPKPSFRASPIITGRSPHTRVSFCERSAELIAGGRGASMAPPPWWPGSSSGAASPPPPHANG